MIDPEAQTAQERTIRAALAHALGGRGHPGRRLGIA